jgi:hypothetical protein
MPSISIDYTTTEGKIFTVLANRTGRTPKEYIEHILREHAEGQIKGYFNSKIRGLSIPQLINLLGDIT